MPMDISDLRVGLQFTHDLLFNLLSIHLFRISDIRMTCLTLLCCHIHVLYLIMHYVLMIHLWSLCLYVYVMLGYSLRLCTCLPSILPVGVYPSAYVHVSCSMACMYRSVLAPLSFDLTTVGPD